MGMRKRELSYDDMAGWEQREIDADLIKDALDPYLRATGDELSSAADLVDELSADELLDWLHRAGLLRVPTRPRPSDAES
jgi:hypothetical protein